MNEQQNKSMKRQLFTSVLCLLTLLLMLIGSTLAWFTDSSYTYNTMEAGKIDIEQKTTSWDTLIMMPTQTYKTEVQVKNTGNNPCYVRTLFAFEDSATVSVVEELELTSPDGVHVEIPGVTTREDKIQFTVTKDGVTTLYTVGYYVHKSAVTVGETVIPLAEVTLSRDANNAWSDAVGTHYEMHVLSQACQQTGMGDFADEALDKAFAPITVETCVGWFQLVLGNDVTVAAVNP